jgi:hypothetical protein
MCWIALDITDEPMPSSTGEYGGERQLDRMYNDDSRDDGCQLSSVLSVWVRVLMMIILDRVPDNVARAWTRNEYGAGSLAGQGLSWVL